MNTPRSLSEDIGTVRATLDELDRIHSAISAIADLTVPGNDLSCVNRDNLATLLDMILGMEKATRDRCWTAVLEMRKVIDAQERAAAVAAAAEPAAMQEPRGLQP